MTQSPSSLASLKAAPPPPILFILYVTNISQPNDAKLNLFQFADDIEIWAQAPGICRINIRLQKYLNQILKTQEQTPTQEHFWISSKVLGSFNPCTLLHMFYYNFYNYQHQGRMHNSLVITLVNQAFFFIFIFTFWRKDFFFFFLFFFFIFTFFLCLQTIL